MQINLPDEVLEQVAQRAAELVLDRQEPPPAWLDTKAAAEYLSTNADRIHDLVSLGKLKPRRDGRRLLFQRDELDDHLE